MPVLYPIHAFLEVLFYVFTIIVIIILNLLIAFVRDGYKQSKPLEK